MLGSTVSMDNYALKGLLLGILLSLGMGGLLGVYIAAAEAKSTQDQARAPRGAACEGPRVKAESSLATSRYADGLVIRIRRDQYNARLAQEQKNQQKIADFLKKKEAEQKKALEQKKAVAKKTTEPKKAESKKTKEAERPLASGSVRYVIATAYTSEVAQTDASPCITANGFNVCKHGIEDVIAANWLPMGTKVRIPDHFGDRVFTVRDRMARKHSDKIDVWMKDKKNAMRFGKRTVKVEVLK